MSDDREGTSVPQDPEREPGITVPFIPHDTANMEAVFARRHTGEAVMTGSSSLTVQLGVAAYPRKLLSVARDLIDQGEPSIAVVVAHMACEVATERRLSEAFVTKGVQYLKDAVMTGSRTGYSLTNDRILKLYTAVTGDEVQQNQPLWSNFTKSVARRNDIVHKGDTVEAVEAEKSYNAASDLLTHLKF
jgi:hypothetical protein